MEKKDIAIIILSVAFLIVLIGFIGTSAKLNRLSAEKGEFMKKLKGTEDLATQMTRNIEDLKTMLGKSEKEKSKLAKEKEEVAKKLEEAAKREKEIVPQVSQ